MTEQRRENSDASDMQTVTLINPNAVENPKFLALKQRVLSGETVTLRYQDVFNLDLSGYIHNPYTLQKITESLKELESKPYGQELFRDILTNSYRTEPTKIAAHLTDGVAKGAPQYSSHEDTLIMPADINFIKSNKNPFYNAALSAKIDSTAAVLLHEGDHAVHVYGAQFAAENPRKMTPEGIIKLKKEYAKSVACWEKQAVDRQNLYHQDKGESLRGDYIHMPSEIGRLTQQLIDKNTNISDPNQLKEVVTSVRESITLNNACNEPLKPEELQASITSVVVDIDRAVGDARYKLESEQNFDPEKASIRLWPTTERIDQRVAEMIGKLEKSDRAYATAEAEASNQPEQEPTPAESYSQLSTPSMPPSTGANVQLR